MNVPASTDVRTTVDASAAPQLDANVMQIVGSPTATKKLTQTIPVSGGEGDTYVVSGWAHADSFPLDSSDAQVREVGIRLAFNYTDDSTKSFVAQFNPDSNSTTNWQKNKNAFLPFFC